MSKVTLVLKKMEKLMWVYLVAWNGWFIPRIIMKVCDLSNGWLKMPLRLVEIMFAIAWTVSLIKIVMLTNKVKKDEVLDSAFNDDFMREAGSQAAKWGFFGAIATSGVMAVLSEFMILNATFCLDMVMLNGINFYIASYLITLKKGDSSE